MKAKRRRIAGKGTMAAWSDGTRTHIGPTLAKELKDEVGGAVKGRSRSEQVDYGWTAGDAEALRQQSRLMEEVSDRLWELDRHVESLLWLMRAARQLIDWDCVSLGPDMNYCHSNLRRFRYVVSRCWERCREDKRLEPLFRESSVYDDFLLMKELYANR